MKRIRFPVKRSKVMKSTLCLITAILLLFTSVSSTVLAAGTLGGTTVNKTSSIEGTGNSEAVSANRESNDIVNPKVGSEQEISDGLPESDDAQEPGTEIPDSGDGQGKEVEGSEESQEDENIKSVVYDPQPETMEEVQVAIDTYESSEEDESTAIQQDESTEGVEVQKPHWEFEVADELMPEGYSCELVDFDEEFGADYFTFFRAVTFAPYAWFGDGTTPETAYQISNAADLAQLATDVNNGNTYVGKYFVLTGNIDLSGISNWTPIGTGSQELIWDHTRTGSDSVILTNAFCGTFDGNGKTISNVAISSSSSTGASADYKGLFGLINGAKITNLNIDNITSSGGSGVAGLVGYATGNFEFSNINITNAKVSNAGSANYGVGTLAGVVEPEENHSILISNCNIKDTYVTGKGPYGRTGGLIGTIKTTRDTRDYTLVNSDISVENCTVIGGEVNSSSYYTGGLIGSTESHNINTHKLTVKNCHTDLPVSGDSNRVGGLIGELWLQGAANSTGNAYANNIEVLLEACSVKGQVKSGSYYAGGLVGEVIESNYNTNNTIRINNCFATGDVAATSYYVGGLLGFVEIASATTSDNNLIYIYKSYATGDVVGNNYYNGGLVGHTHNGVIIDTCYATGDVTGGSYRNGGLVGYSYGDGHNGHAENGYRKGFNVIKNSYATGNVTGSSFENGGFIGFADNTDLINCFSIGSVNGKTYADNGGFAGAVYSSPVRGSDDKSIVQNCYATGTVKGSAGTTGGFLGNVDNSGANTRYVFENCFYDTTTTKQAKGVGYERSNPTVGEIVGKSTEEMIEEATFADWAVKDNRGGRSAGLANEGSPWYIDHEITYPYLWYQYDGHTKEEVNYNLGSTKYSFVDGSVTNKHLGQRRADFVLPTAGTNQATYYNVKTTGAQKAYFPFMFADFPFNGTKEIRIPGSGSHTVANATTMYSLGGVSATDIVSFDPLPYAEKTSDRTPYEEGVESTYTMRGDLIEYSILISNPSIRYEWLGVKLTDALPEGLTLVEGLYNSENYEVKVKVTDTDGIVSDYVVPKDTPSGSDPYYYEYSKATADGETDSDLVVYLGDMPVADEDTGAMPTIEVIFTAIPDRRAVSLFPLNDPANIAANGDNIRNTGIVEGTIREVEDHTNTFEYDTDFDDENTDPVYDSYKVSYIGNGGKTAAGDTEYNEFYLYDKTFTVNDNQGVPFKYTWLYHTYLDEWYSRPELIEGSTEIYEHASTHGLVSNVNPIPDGYRESTDLVDNVYEDYYAKTDFKLYAGWREDKGSITIIKEGDMGDDDQPVKLENAYFLLERQVDDGAGGTTWEKVKWDGSSESWVEFQAGDTYSGVTDVNGRLEFGKDNDDSTTGINDPSTLPFGTYRITEVKSPEGYTLLDKPLIATIPFEKVLGKDEQDPNDGYVTTVEEGDNIRYLYYDITYTVQNVANFELPESGYGDILPHMIWIAGAAIMTVSAGFYLYYRKRIASNV